MLCGLEHRQCGLSPVFRAKYHNKPVSFEPGLHLPLATLLTDNYQMPDHLAT